MAAGAATISRFAKYTTRTVGGKLGGVTPGVLSVASSFGRGLYIAPRSALLGLSALRSEAFQQSTQTAGRNV